MSGSFYSLQLFKCSLLHRKDSPKKKNNPLHGNGFTVPFPENFIKVFLSNYPKSSYFYSVKMHYSCTKPKETKVKSMYDFNPFFKSIYKRISSEYLINNFLYLKESVFRMPLANFISALHS